MRLAVLDETDKIVVEYDASKVKELLKKYVEVLKDVDKAFDQLSEDLLNKARSKR